MFYEYVDSSIELSTYLTYTQYTLIKIFGCIINSIHNISYDTKYQESKPQNPYKHPYNGNNRHFSAGIEQSPHQKLRSCFRCGSTSCACC